MYRDDVVISTQFADINGDLKPEKVTLFGIPDGYDSPFMKSLKLIVESDTSKTIFPINMQGYQFNLVLANVLPGQTKQILITGQYGGTGGYAVFNMYEYKNDKLKLLLDDSTLANKLNCTASYLDNYKVEISCLNPENKYTIDISNNFKGYLDLIYDKNGIASKSESPIISAPNTIYPIITPYNDFSSLQVQQRIVGVSNGDILGAIQSVIQFDAKGNASVKERYFITIDKVNM